MLAKSTVGFRSETKRARRRAESKRKYRGKDKAEVVARMTAEQGGCCAICGCKGGALGDGTRGLVLDHCHETGRPRAMLCGRCNAAIGFAREDAKRLEAMALYVRRWRDAG